MNDLDALRLMVKHFPGGLEVIALRVGKPAETLRKELAGAQGFKLGYLTATTIRDLCIEAGSEHCFALTNVFCAGSGGFVRLPVVEMREPACINKTVSDTVREMSDVTTATLQANADNEISDNELKSTLKEIGEAREALQKLERALIARNFDGKPASVQAQSNLHWVREYDKAPA
jgi:hypothetical protein